MAAGRCGQLATSLRVSLMIAALRVQLDCRSQRGDRGGSRPLNGWGRSPRHACGDCEYQQPAPELPDHGADVWDGSLGCTKPRKRSGAKKSALPDTRPILSSPACRTRARPAATRESTTAMMATGSSGDCVTTLSSLANGRLGRAAA